MKNNYIFKTYKVFSLCDLFGEMPELSNYILEVLAYGSCTGVYVSFTINSNANENISEISAISKILIENGAIEGEEVLIHIDY